MFNVRCNHEMLQSSDPEHKMRTGFFDLMTHDSDQPDHDTIRVAQLFLLRRDPPTLFVSRPRILFHFLHSLVRDLRESDYHPSP